jgi:hypothetical protein
MANRRIGGFLPAVPRLPAVLLTSNWIRVLAALVLVAGVPRLASATTIAVGAHIPIDATTFAVPIDITAGANVIGWQFDLTYDPTDVQVNASCDPFSADILLLVLDRPGHRR